MAYLFDTDAISELLKPKPAAAYVAWIRSIPREEQFTSAVCVGELYHGAFRSPRPDRHLENIDNRVLPAATVLPFDAAVARVYGRIRSRSSQPENPSPMPTSRSPRRRSITGSSSLPAMFDISSASTTWCCAWCSRRHEPAERLLHV